MAIPKRFLDNDRCSDERLISESVFSCDSGSGFMIGFGVVGDDGCKW